MLNDFHTNLACSIWTRCFHVMSCCYTAGGDWQHHLKHGRVAVVARICNPSVSSGGHVLVLVRAQEDIWVHGPWGHDLCHALWGFLSCLVLLSAGTGTYHDTGVTTVEVQDYYQWVPGVGCLYVWWNLSVSICQWVSVCQIFVSVSLPAVCDWAFVSVSVCQWLSVLRWICLSDWTNFWTL